jgi:nucleoid-associated protein
MILKKLVIHELSKEAGSQGATYKTGKLLDVTKKTSLKLVDEISKIYGRTGNSAIYGCFARKENDNKFPLHFDEYVKDDVYSDDSFMALTIAAMVELTKEAKKQQSATGGHIVFYHFTQDARDFFLMAMIKQTAGLNINGNLELEDVTEIELSKIHQAAKINFTLFLAQKVANKVQDDEDEDDDAVEHKSYLSFVSPASYKEVSGYFISALDCTDGVSPRKATTRAFNCVNAYIKLLDELRPHQVVVKDSLVDYLSGCVERKTPATLSGVDSAIRAAIPAKLHDFINGFIDFANSDEYQLPAEFGVNSAKVKYYSRIKVKSRRWNLEFDVAALGITPGSDLMYDEKNNVIVIRCNVELKEKALAALRERE